MPLTRFTLRQLEALVVAADLHGFSAAAAQMGMTAQAISQLVAELESVLGFRLFDRTTRRITLTSAGRDFLVSAQTAMRHVHAAETAADDLRNRAAGLVRIGAPLVLASTALPAAIKAYQVTRPKVSVRIQDVAVDALVDGVEAGDLDLAIGPDRPPGLHVARESLFDSPWVLWCAPDHALAQHRQVRWAALRAQRLVAAGRDHEQSVAQMRNSLPEDARVTPVEVVSNITTALGIASQGLAATLAPGYVGVLAAKFGVVMRRVVDPESVRKVCLYRPTLRALSPAAEGFAEHLVQWLPQWAARHQGAVRSRRVV